MFRLRDARSMLRLGIRPSWEPPMVASNSNCSDPLEQAVAAGLAAGHAHRRLPARRRASLLMIRDRARASGDRAAAIVELLPIVRLYPCAEPPQKIVARLLHEMHDERALEAWSGIARRFPNSMDTFRTLLTLTHRRAGPEAAGLLIRSRFPKMPTDFQQLLAYAYGCELVGAAAEARAAVERLSQLSARRASVRRITSWRTRRQADGDAVRRAVIEAAITPRRAGPTPASVTALETLFEQVLASRSAALQREQRRRAPVVFLVGSLGPGGAERQLVTTAIGLDALATDSANASDLAPQPVGVLARSLSDRSDGAFFLADLQRAGIPVNCYRDLPDFNGNPDRSVVRPMRTALKLLPRPIAEAMTKTTDLLRALDPEVVHIWQDGLIYAAGLAALLAGVPRIILNPRSVPQPDRRTHYPVEYEVIYRSMLRAPGVKLSVNSRHAAGRYAEWLGIDRDGIAVIANGVQPAAAAPDMEAEEMFAAFEARTAGSSLTLGTVMRLDANKRPILWVDVAARLLRAMPTSRFIVVGDGPLRAAAIRHAAAQSVLHRILFVGRSSCVGYWLSKMTVFLLLSEHEGLPNALIEAQLAGLAVVVSPAGGAAETLIPGVTGLVTSRKPTPDEVATLIADLAAAPGRLPAMGATARAWAETAFPIAPMIEKTLKLYRAVGEAAYGPASLG